MNEIIEKLEDILEMRKSASDADSYVASLYKQGDKQICDKILEEAQELVDSIDMKDDQIVHESADLLFHVLVLLRFKNIKYVKILNELDRRFGTSGIVEKNNRNK